MSSPPEGSSLLRAKVRTMLPRIVKTQQFKKVLEKVSDRKRSQFLKSLMSCHPVPGKPISVLYATSAAGVIDEFEQKFINSKSVTALFTRSGKSKNARKLLLKAKQMDIQRINWVLKRVES